MGLALRRALGFSPRNGSAVDLMQTAPKPALTGTTERSTCNDLAEQVCLVQRFLQWEMTRSG